MTLNPVYAIDRENICVPVVVITSITLEPIHVT